MLLLASACARACVLALQGVHKALHAQALDAGGEGDGGPSRGLDIASLVHRYGRSFVHSNPDVALEYYMRVGAPKPLVIATSMCCRSIETMRPISRACLRPSTLCQTVCYGLSTQPWRFANMGAIPFAAHQGDRACLVPQAAQLKGDTLEVKAQLLRELLTESNAFGYLIGSGAPGAGGGQLHQSLALSGQHKAVCVDENAVSAGRVRNILPRPIFW